MNSPKSKSLRQVPHPPTPKAGVKSTPFPMEELMFKLREVAEFQQRREAFFAPCEKAEDGSLCWSYADQLRGGRMDEPYVAPRVTPGTWAVCGIIPTIVISTPSQVRAELRAAKRQAWLERRRLGFEARKRRTARPNEEPAYVRAFFEEVEQGWRQKPHSWKTYLKAIAAFKKMWVFEHNKRKLIVKSPKVEEPKVVFPTLPPQGKMPKHRASPSSFSSRSDKAQEGVSARFVIAKTRSVMLLTKIRSVCERMAAKRFTSVKSKVVRRFARIERREYALRYLLRTYRQTRREPRHIERFEMDDGKEGEQAKCIPASNVTLQSHTEESTVRLKPKRAILKKIAGGDDLQDYAHLTDRWIEFANVPWTTEQEVNSDLFNDILPYKAVIDNPDSANFNPLRVHQYGRFDMDIRAQINATKFQVGAAQMSWYYCADEDANTSLRSEVSMCSQLPHSDIDVSSANDATMSIPYKHYQSFISLKKRSDVAPPLNLGRLRLMVLNKLRVAEGSSNTCYITLYLKFSKSDLMGMTDAKLGTLTEGEMLPMIAVGAATAILNQANSDHNRDRPPYQGARMAVVPGPAQSLCLGDQITEPLNSMRLNAKGQTPHPEYDGENEMLISNIVNRFMLIKQWSWDTDLKAGDKLGKIEASPILDPSEYWKGTRQGKTVYEMPPVAVVSSLFGAWRGRIKVKFQFISSQFHSGRLLFTYVPHYIGEVTKKQLKSSAGVTFDLGSQREFVFEFPYMSNRPFWPHRLSTGVDTENYLPPGYLHVYVQNVLQCASNMPNSIDINIYMAAMDDFEVAYPVQPAIGLSWDCRHFNPNKAYVVAQNGYHPYYVSWWKQFYFNGKNQATFATGSGSNDIARFCLSEDDSAPLHGNYYQFEVAESWKPLSVELARSDGTKVTLTEPIFHPVSVKDGAGAVYFMIYESLDTLRQDLYTRTPKGWVFNQPYQCDWKNALIRVADGKWNTGNPHFVFTQVTPPVREIELTDLEMGEVNDERTAQASSGCLEVPPPAAMQSSELLWGEKFTDLKSLMRRYQLYNTFIGTIEKSNGPRISHVCNFACLPQGLDLPYTTDPGASARREGIIPILLSGYRFYRGSLNFKFVFSVEKDCVFYIQHRPDRACLDTHLRSASRTDMDGMFHHGYATVYVDTRINRQVTVNVPYYQLGAYGLLQRPNIDRQKVNVVKNYHFSLGQLYIFSDSLYVQQASIKIFYSIGDDFRAEEFVGFPEMSLIKDYETWGIEEPEMPVVEGVAPENAVKAACSRITDSITRGVINTVNNVKEATEENVVSPPPKLSMRNKLLKWFSEPIIEEMEKTIQEFKKAFNIEISLAHILNIVVSNAAHCALSPSMGHVAVLVASFLLELGILGFEIISKFISSLDGLLTKFGRANEQPEALGDDLFSVEIASLLISGIAAICGIKNIQEGGILGVSAAIIKVVQQTGRAHLGVTALCRSLFGVIVKIIDKIEQYINKDRLTQYWITKTPDIVRKYYREATDLLNPAFEERLLTDSKEYARLDVTVYVGSLLLRDLTVNDRKVSVVTALLQIQQRLMQLRERAHKNNASISKRREPYCLHLTGPPGIGKSQISETIVDQLLEAANVKQTGAKIYVHTNGLKHWDGYINQPAILFDDLSVLRDATLEGDEFSAIFRLKSCAPFRPPMADLSDKGRFCAPELVLINSNQAYPSRNILGTSTALFRRYDDVIDVALTSEVFEKVRNISNMESLKKIRESGVDLSKFQHLCFSVHQEPGEPTSTKSNTLNWEQLMVYLKRRFVEYRAHQFSLLNYKTHYNLSTVLENPEEAMRTFLASHSQDSVAYSLYKKALSIFIPNVSSTKQICEEMQMIHQAFEAEDPIPGTSDEDVPLKQEEDLTFDVLGDQRVSLNVDTTGLQPKIHFIRYGLSEESGSAETRTTAVAEKTKLSYTRAIAMIRRAKMSLQAVPEADSETVRIKHGENLRLGCPHSIDILADYCYDFDEDELVRTETRDCSLPVVCAEAEKCRLKVYGSRRNLMRALSQTPSWALTFRACPDLFDRFDEKKKPLKIMSKESFDKEVETTLGMIQIDASWRKLSVLKRVFVALVLPSCIIFSIYSAGKGLVNLFKAKHPKTPAEVVYSKHSKRNYAEIVPSGDNKTVAAKRAGRGLIKRLPESVQLEFGELASPTSMTSLVRRNTFFLTFTGTSPLTKETLRTSARCLGICEHYAIFPKHYLVFYLGLEASDRKCFYFLDSEPINIKLSELPRWEIDEDELCIVQLPKVIPLFRDIRRQFMSFERITGVLPKQAHFCETSNDRVVELVSVDIFPKEDVLVRVDGVDVFIGQAIGYNYHGKGRCGSVVLTGADGGRIIGMHVSGREGSGTASYLYQEMFTMMGTNCYDLTDFDNQLSNITTKASPNRTIQGAFVDLGTVDNILAQNQSGDSQIKPNLLWGTFEPTTDVAILSKYHPLAFSQDPMELGVNKQGRPVTSISDETMEIAVEDYRNEVFSKVIPILHITRPLTVLEACRGVREMGLKSLDLNTSEGFPWSSVRPKSACNKRWLFHFDSDTRVDGLHPTLANAVLNGISKRERLVVQPTVFTNCLKDARLPLERIKPDKTRVFSTAPIDFTIICRMYFAPFFQCWQKARLEHQVGMAVQKAEWSGLGREMGEFSEFHLCGDYSSFGDTLDPTLVEASFDIAIEWLFQQEKEHLPYEVCKKNRNVRLCIKQEITHAIRLTGNMLLQAYCGMPSGNPVTVDINSMVNSMYIRCAWIEMFKSMPHFQPMDRMHSLIRIKVYGDDVWIAVKRMVIDLFNNSTLSKQFEKMGIKYTDSSKSATDVKSYSTFDEVSFLKSKFIPHPTRKGNFLAALDKGSVTDCAIWSRNSKDNEVASTLESAYACLLLAYGWGPTYFNQIRSTLIDACKKRGLGFRPRTWDNIDQMYYVCDEYERLHPEMVLDYTKTEDLIKLYESIALKKEITS